jgi:hypothetical protein
MNDNDAGTVTLTANPTTGEVVAADAATPFDQPGAATRDWIWRLIVITFCAGIGLLLVALIVSMFIRPVSDTIVGLVHGIALLLIGYIAGLMQRSPQHA